MQTCSNNTHTEYSPIRLNKALLILLLYPVLGAPPLILLELLVAFLLVPSEEEYPELSTPLRLDSVWSGLRCKPGLLEPYSPA